MISYVLAPEAEQDLNDILDYIAKDNLSAARRVISELNGVITNLAEHPLMGHFREDLADEPIRFWPVYSYLIVYRFESRPIQIIRVLHGAQDVQAILGTTKKQS